MLVKIILVFCISQKTRIHSEILVGICINAFSVRGCCARSFTGANVYSPRKNRHVKASKNEMGHSNGFVEIS